MWILFACAIAFKSKAIHDTNIATSDCLSEIPISKSAQHLFPLPNKLNPELLVSCSGSKIYRLADSAAVNDVKQLTAVEIDSAKGGIGVELQDVRQKDNITG